MEKPAWEVIFDYDRSYHHYDSDVYGVSSLTELEKLH